MNKTHIVYIIFIGLLLLASELQAQDRIEIAPLSVNTENREYAPAFYKNGLVYCGDNLNNEGLTYVEDESGKQLTDLFFVNLEDSAGRVSLFSKELKTSFHDGPICFSADGNTAYFTRSQIIKRELKNKTERFNKFGIYTAEFNGEEWVNVEACLFNSPDYNVGHPSLSADGKTLYVVSDKPDGHGGIDIYASKLENGIWGPLENLGDNVNSAANEMFPSITPNGRLYFSSNRDGGRGGLDLYYSDFYNEGWTKVIPLDTTFNSSFDDFGIIYDTDETGGYFCSNRLGSDDIFKFSLVYPEFGPCEELVNELLCYEFYEEATLNVDSVSMIYEWNFGDGHKERSLETFHCYEQSGFYIVELNIFDPMVDKDFVNVATYELLVEEVIQPKVDCPDTVSIGQGFMPVVSQGKWNKFQIQNIYIDYGDSTRIIKNPGAPHQYTRSGFKNMRILTSGFNDSGDSVLTQCFYKNVFVRESNVLLANEEKEFLEKLKYSKFNVEKLEEIDEDFYALELFNSKEQITDSLVFKNYKDTVREIYLEKLDMYSYVLGQVDNPFDLIEAFRTAHKSGFDSAIVKAYEDGKMTIADLGITYNDEKGDVNIVLNNIHFMYDGYKLDETSKKELKKLITYLNENENIRIEIGAHTDASRNVEKAKLLFKQRGQTYSKAAHDKMSSGYNLSLSQKRANSVVSYIVQSGIAKNRLLAKGYGETKPVEPNYFEDGSDNPEGRAKNRRVEFKILD